MHILKKNVFLFITGGSIYAAIELMWRGRTHVTMLIAGGLSLIIFSLVEEYFKSKSALLRAGLCSLGVTAIELIFGVIFNIIYDMKIWDYSDQPLNLLGQICPLFSLIWGGLALVSLPIVDFINEIFNRSEKVNV